MDPTQAYTLGGDGKGIRPSAMADPPTETFLSPGSDVYVNSLERELVAVPGIHPTVRYHSLIVQKGGHLAPCQGWKSLT